MSLELYLILETDSHETAEKIAIIDSEVVQIGREPSDQTGIQLDSKTVSRVHGIFERINGHWFFKDLGSSNGSWLNGKHMSAEQRFILRSGDELQLADVFLSLRFQDEEVIPATVLVFSRGDLQSEIEIPENGKFLTVGGAKADFKMDIELGALPQFVFEKRSGFLCVYPISSDYRTTVNGSTLDNLVQLKDRDVIQLSPYEIVVNKPEQTSAQLELSAKNAESTGFSSWEEHEKAPKSHLFGRARTDTSEYGQDPLRTVDSPKVRKDLNARLDSVEEKLVAILGFVLVLLTLGAVLWWFLR